MKNLRPSILILLGSLLYLVLSITSALLFHLFVLELSPWVIILIPVISALVVFILFYALLKNFIQRRFIFFYISIRILDIFHFSISFLTIIHKPINSWLTIFYIFNYKIILTSYYFNKLLRCYSTNN